MTCEGCNAPCCRCWRVPLSRDEARHLEHTRPRGLAILARNPDGSCIYFDGASPYGCSIYESRPQACRDYDCARDRRVHDEMKWGDWPPARADEPSKGATP